MMGISQVITWRSLPIETTNTFQANFNAPLGQYGFTQNTANQNQVLLDNTNPNYIYLIDTLSYSASIPESIYLESLGGGSIPPSIRLKFQKDSGAYLYPRAFPAINYKDNMQFSFWFRTPQNVNRVLVDMFGVVNQVAATVGVPEIIAQFSLVIYQENNGDKIQKMLMDTANSIGNFYRMGE